MNDALRGGHGEVGVLKLGNDDNWEVPLEGPYDAADEEGREETETAGGRRAMRVGPKTRRDAMVPQKAPNFLTCDTTGLLTQIHTAQTHIRDIRVVLWSAVNMVGHRRVRSQRV
jgi:hypothetical protein